MAEIGDRIGQVKTGDVIRQRVCNDSGEERVGHRIGNSLQIGGANAVAALPGESGARGVVFPGRIEPHDPLAIHHLQASADMDRSGGDHLAIIQQAELGGPSADIDIKDTLGLVARYARGARAIGG